MKATTTQKRLLISFGMCRYAYNDNNEKEDEKEIKTKTLLSWNEGLS